MELAQMIGGFVQLPNFPTAYFNNCWFYPFVISRYENYQARYEQDKIFLFTILFRRIQLDLKLFNF